MQEINRQFATAPRSIVQVWCQAFKLTHPHLLSLYGLFFCAKLLVLSASFCIKDPSSASFLYGDKFVEIGVALFVIGSILTLINYSAGIFLANAVLSGQPHSLKQALGKALKIFIKIGLSALAWLILFGGVFSVFCLFYFFFHIHFALLCLLFLPLLYPLVATYYFFPNLVLGGQGVITAIKKTYSQLKGHWWRGFFTLALPFYLMSVFNKALGMLIKAFSGVTKYSADITQTFLIKISLLSFCTQIPSMFLQAYFSLIALAIIVLQWHDLKLRRQLKL